MAALAGALWAANYTTRHFENPDAFDYAQMGHQIRLGRGMTTQHVLPRHVPYLEAKGLLESGPVPNLYRYPLPTLLNAGFETVTGDPVRAAVLQCGAWFVLGVVAFFFLTERFSDWRFALLSSGVLLTDPSFRVHAYSGMTESLSIFLLLVLALLASRDSGRTGRWLLAGAVCGLALLARYQLAFLGPVTILAACLAAPGGRRGGAALAVLVGLGAVIAPWMVRNVWLTGDPFFSFSTAGALMVGSCPTGTYLDWKLHAPAETADVFRLYGDQILRKFARALWPGILNPFALAGSWLYGALACGVVVWGVMTPRREACFERLRWGTLALLAANYAVICLAYPTFRFFETLHPLLLAVALLSGARFLDARLPEARRGAARSLFAALVLAGLGALRLLSGGWSSPEGRDATAQRDSYRILADLTEPRAVVASDVSYRVALWSDRLAVRLPAPDPEELFEIDRDYLPVDYVLFSRKAAEAEPSPSVEDPCRGPAGVGGFFKSPYGRYRALANSDRFRRTFTAVRTLPNGDVLYRRLRSPSPAAG